MASGLWQGEHKELFWNVDAHVGPGCPNKPDDVNLVQLGFKAAGKRSPDPEAKTICNAVVLGAPYTGSPTDPLSLAIKYMQKRRGAAIDGRVSPCKQVGSMAQAIDLWMLTALVMHIRDELARNWPHLDRWPGCPPALAAVSRKVMGGSGSQS